MRGMVIAIVLGTAALARAAPDEDEPIARAHAVSARAYSSRSAEPQRASAHALAIFNHPQTGIAAQVPAGIGG
jgi:hypothetical protein